MNIKLIQKLCLFTFLGIALTAIINWLSTTFFDINMFTLAAMIFAIFGSIFWLWILFDCIINESKEKTNKPLWITVIIFTNGFGALAYYFLRRPKRQEEFGK